jgi:hypothetical protein
MGSVRGRGRRFALAGGLTGIIGAVILAGDKGALCLVLSAFDSLPETDFAGDSRSGRPAQGILALTTITRRGHAAVDRAHNGKAHPSGARHRRHSGPRAP